MSYPKMIVVSVVSAVVSAVVLVAGGIWNLRALFIAFPGGHGGAHRLADLVRRRRQVILVEVDVALSGSGLGMPE